MENATKALLMSAGILIGILIISLAVYLFRNIESINEKYEETEKTKELAIYNNKFERYESRSDLTIHDLVTIFNFTDEYEKKYNKIITVKLDGTTFNITDVNGRIKKDIEENETTERITYTCTSIEYENGKVKTIKFVTN